MRSTRSHADRLGLSYAHFRGHRRWTDAELVKAVADSASWGQVADSLGLVGGSAISSLKGHAARLGLSPAFGAEAPEDQGVARPLPSLRNLARAGSLLAAGWFTMCGFDVAWPLEPSPHDLLVQLGDGPFSRIQVKATTLRAGQTWVARLTQSGKGHRPFDPDDIDYFFVIDGSLSYYLIPVTAVGGLQSTHVAAYARYRVRTGEPDR